MYKHGFSVVGDHSPSGLWRLKTAEEMQAAAPTVSVETLKVNNAHYTRQLILHLELSHARAVARGDTEALELERAAWDASVHEVNVKGSAHGPLSLNAMKRRFGGFDGPTPPRPIARHAVRQGA